ncbi:unnamed protein product, partial [Ectocarpus sp. 12 AP-2014]
LPRRPGEPEPRSLEPADSARAWGVFPNGTGARPAPTALVVGARSRPALALFRDRIPETKTPPSFPRSPREPNILKKEHDDVAFFNLFKPAHSAHGSIVDKPHTMLRTEAEERVSDHQNKKQAD